MAIKNLLYSDLIKKYAGKKLKILSHGFVDDPQSIYHEKIKEKKTGEYKIVEIIETKQIFKVWRGIK